MPEELAEELHKATLDPRNPFDFLPDELLLTILEHALPVPNANDEPPTGNAELLQSYRRSIVTRGACRRVEKRWNAVLEGAISAVLGRGSDGALFDLDDSRLVFMAESVTQLHIVVPAGVVLDGVAAVVGACRHLAELSMCGVLPRPEIDELIDIFGRAPIKVLDLPEVPFDLLEPLLVRTNSPLRDLRIKGLRNVPVELPPLTARLSRLHVPLHLVVRYPDVKIPLEFVSALVTSSQDTLSHLHIVAPQLFPDIDVELTSLILSLAPTLRSLKFTLLYPHGGPFSLLENTLPSLTNLTFLQPGDYPHTLSSFRFLASQPRLEELRLSWDAKRAREGLDWSWIELSEQLNESEGRRERVLSIYVAVHGVLRDYDIAQRAAWSTFAQTELKKVRIWLQYWETPYRVV